MRYFLLLCLFWVPMLAHGQQGFLKVDGSAVAQFQDMVNKNDTLVFFALTFDSLSQQGIGFYKIDTFGNILQRKVIVDTSTLLSLSSFISHELIKTSDNGFAMIGAADNNQRFFLKVNDDFEIMSLVFFDIEYFTRNRSLTETNDGYLLLLDITPPSNSITQNTLIISVTQNGNEKWRKEYGTTEYSEVSGSIIKKRSNEYVIAGAYTRSPSFNEPNWPYEKWVANYFFAIDTLGNELWEWRADSLSLTGGISRQHLLLADSSWLYLSANWIYDDNYGLLQPMIIHRDKDFNIIWQKPVGNAGPFIGFSDLEMTSDSNFIASGQADMTVNGEDFPLGIHYKFNIDGDSIWLRTDSIYNKYDDTKITATEILSSGSIISIGYVEGPFGDAGFIMKLTPDGCLDTLNCFLVETTPVLPKANRLVIYPNPTIDQVNIRFSPQGNMKYHIQVMNWQGQVIFQLETTVKNPVVNVASLPPGPYVINILSGEKQLVGKFIKQ